MNRAIFLRLDDAWPDAPIELPTLDALEWGRQLRFCAPAKTVEKFYRDFQLRLAPFTLYGSGDFHYLSGIWLRQFREILVLVSFDNHPDWAITPPKWACGCWINRALELPQVKHVSIWGCGNFECWWPHSVLGNRKAERQGRLEVHPWADHRPIEDRGRAGAILRENWRQRFEEFAAELGGANVYTTIDLDCLRADEAATNWENGNFTVEDVEWALGKLRENARIVGGDVCGAYSTPDYARWTQEFAANWDHPKIPPPSSEQIKSTSRAIERLWPALTH
ncbi:MAG TPA: hypothetical protein VFA58_00870 [Chthoniobacterales bacterium]|nr:hypothetical protein [Chthoniobacterales bacterium]